MPELPEVETLRRHLSDELTGRRIDAAWADPAPKYASAAAAAGHRIEQVNRRGKFLVIELEDQVDLIVHLGMTGQLLLGPEPADHVRAWFRTGRSTLWFRDPRRFGRALLIERGDLGAVPSLAALGPEPLSAGCTPKYLESVFTRPGQPVKARLLDQRIIAGVGNYLADEALFAAGVHPLARSVNNAQARALHAALEDLVTRSLAAGGMSTRDYVHLDGSTGGFASELRVYGRAGLPCLWCADLLERIKVAGRSSTFCPTCQPRS